MPGINDNIIFPILDLIKREVRRELIGIGLGNEDNVVNQYAGNLFKGYPSVQLIREHPIDYETVTGARLHYVETGLRVNITLSHGMDEELFNMLVEKNKADKELIDSLVADDVGEEDLSHETLDDIEINEGVVENWDTITHQVLPPDVLDDTHPDYEYYRYFRLNSVYIEIISPTGGKDLAYNINLIYDNENLLAGTEVNVV